MYDDILLPTDGSEASYRAIRHADEIAEKFNSNIHILYVINVNVMPEQLTSGAHLEQMKQIGEEVTESVEDELNSESVEKHVETGMPHKKINEYIKNQDIDLVTMGSHGRSGLDRVLLGSVTEKVLRTGEAAVLTVKEKEE